MKATNHISKVVLSVGLFFCLQPIEVLSRSLPQSESPIKIEVLTIGAGNTLPLIWSWWGHTAVRVIDSEKNVDIVFDYGILPRLDFGTLLLNYIKGFTIYYTGISNTRVYFAELKLQNRRVISQALSLSEEKARKFYEKMIWDYQSGKQGYQYNQFNNNCTTKVRNLINEAMDNALYEKFHTIPAKTIKLRESIEPFQRIPILYLLGFATGGSKVNARKSVWESAFLPNHLMEILEDYRQSAEKHPLKDKIEANIRESLQEKRQDEHPITTWNFSVTPLQTLLENSTPPTKPNLLKIWLIFSIFLVGYFVCCCLVPALLPNHSKHFSMISIAAALGWWIWVLFAGIVGLIFYASYFINPTASYGYTTIGYAPFIHILHPFLLLLPIGWFLLRKRRRTIWYHIHLALGSISVLGCILAVFLAPSVLFFALPSCIIEFLLVRQIQQGWN